MKIAPCFLLLLAAFSAPAMAVTSEPVELIVEFKSIDEEEWNDFIAADSKSPFEGFMRAGFLKSNDLASASSATPSDPDVSISSWYNGYYEFSTTIGTMLLWLSDSYCHAILKDTGECVFGAVLDTSLPYNTPASSINTVLTPIYLIKHPFAAWIEGSFTINSSKGALTVTIERGSKIKLKTASGGVILDY